MSKDRHRWHGKPVATWAQFHRIVKRPERALLARLDDYEDAVLVAGCQRSGTTAVTRLLQSALDMAPLSFCRDDELAGALLLAGQAQDLRTGRQCFQTTYLNDRVDEYFEHADYRLVWIIREPVSVIHSMLFNWKRGALKRLYDALGRTEPDEAHRNDGLLGHWLGPPALEMACAAYVAKTRQTFELHRRLGHRMQIVDYRDLMLHKQRIVPRICEFAGIDPGRAPVGTLHSRSIGRDSAFPDRIAERIQRTCAPLYDRVRELGMSGACRAA